MGIHFDLDEIDISKLDQGIQGHHLENLELFFFPSCPFCQRVVIDLEQNHPKLNPLIARCNIFENQTSAQRLKSATGKTTVPCLRFDLKGEEHWLFESSHIQSLFQSLSKLTTQ